MNHQNLPPKTSQASRKPPPPPPPPHGVHAVFKVMGKFGKTEVPVYMPGKFGENVIFGDDIGEEIICGRGSQKKWEAK